MFTNNYGDSFGESYSSGVYEKAQAANSWSLAYTLLYALSKNGMRYATATTGKCSVINNTSLTPACQMTGNTTGTSATLKITFKQMVLVIYITTSSDGKHAFPHMIRVTDTDGNTLDTLFGYSSSYEGDTLAWNDTASTTIFGPNCSFICNWSNDPDTDEGKYRVQTATFKDASDNYDIVSLHFWAEATYLGAIAFFKAKNYFAWGYKYGFYMHKALNDVTVCKFADGTDCAIHPIFEDAGMFTTKTAKTCFFTGDKFAGLIGGINGIYQITDGDSTLSLMPENKVEVNGCDFQAVIPGLFARTS